MDHPDGSVYGPRFPHPVQNQFAVSTRMAGYCMPQPPTERKRLYEEVDGIVPVVTKRHSSEGETVFRLLVPEMRLPSVMNGMSEMQLPAGCWQRLCAPVPHCDEHVVVISAKDERKDDDNMAMQGLLESVRRVLHAEQATRESTRASNPIFMIRLLINRTQAGAVIGKAGVLNKDIRERTGAYSKILTTEDIPVCALHNDRVVQVTGSVEQVMAGMEIIARQLRDNVPKERPGGPPPCLRSLNGFTLYYAHEAPPYIPATEYGRPIIHPGLLPSPSYQVTAPPVPGQPIYGIRSPQPAYMQFGPQTGPTRMYAQHPMVYSQGRPPAFNGPGGQAYYY